MVQWSRRTVLPQTALRRERSGLDSRPKWPDERVVAPLELKPVRSLSDVQDQPHRTHYTLKSAYIIPAFLYALLAKPTTNRSRAASGVMRLRLRVASVASSWR